MDEKNSLLAAVLALFLPERCRACHGPSLAPLCPDCLATVTYCGAGDKGNPPCRSLCLYQQPVSGLIHRLKYGADRAVLPALAEIVSRCGPDLNDDCDLIIPVPLHISRLRQRGLNQSLLLARLFFPKRLPAVRCDLLIRHRPTRPQTGLSGGARRRNLSGAFSLTAASGIIVGKRLLLVDDVRTTGSTLAECGRVLIAHGAARVSYLTMASADW
ncbi:MAG: ComF family protein [Desulfobulbaceae bacterium]|jgi:ComF family protein|nr:ComF family protein [Desulfobulbaceae bacterium]